MIRTGLIAAFTITGACGGGATGDDAAETDAPTGPALPDVIAVQVDGTPMKGDAIDVVITIANPGGAGTVRVAPRVSTDRFTGFSNIPLGSADFALAAGETAEVRLSAGPFLESDAGWFALGRANYVIPAVAMLVDGEARPDDETFDGGQFAIAASGALLQAVMYDEAYFTAIGWTDTPEAYLRGASTRASELFADPGTYTTYPGGFDEMMGIEQHFLALPGLMASDVAGGFCEQVAARARTALGLARDWDTDESQPSHTDAAHHGFDLLIGLTPEMGGGAACGWLGVQVSGLFGFDLSLDRSQIIVVHETGHLFGAPHCDPLQGYVMCAGEQHPHYRDNGIFVWHQVSRDAMADRWQ